jgi:predicted transcriptional regulator
MNIARTKEEKFLVAVYEAATELGDFTHEVNRYTVGQNIGLHPRGIDTICNQLAQANFIKKRGSENVMMTQNGLNLIKEILGE